MSKPHSSFPQWRLKPSDFSSNGSEFESIQILLGKFIADHHSSSPWEECSLLTENSTFEWGKGYPLEKVVNAQGDLETLLANPQLFRNAVAIIEPWDHVGYNPLGEHVRASVNVAYLLQKIADCESVLFPVWSSGTLDLERLMPAISSGLAIIVEGGDSSARDPASFAESNISHEEMIRLTEAILLSRSPTSAPALFICLGHQLAAHAHITLIKRAVREVLALENLERDRGGKFLKLLKQVCQEIQAMGESLPIQKRDGRIVAQGWDDWEFAVTENEAKEFGARHLLPYESPDSEETSGIPDNLIWAHEVTADIHEGVIDTSMAYQKNLNIAMFHADEVNEEAILFANWAYRLLHEALIPCRHIVAKSSLSWLIKLPDAIEILCSTEADGELVTECSATCINYLDFESRQIRRSFTCQFHPELLADLRAIGMREPPSYSELKQDDGARLFARLLYAAMQD